MKQKYLWSVSIHKKAMKKWGFKKVKKNLGWEEGTKDKRSRVLPKAGVYGMKINQVVNDIEECKIDDNENEENLNVIYFVKNVKNLLRTEDAHVI